MSVHGRRVALRIVLGMPLHAEPRQEFLTAVVNNSRFLRNDRKAWHGHASLIADRLLFKL